MTNIEDFPELDKWLDDNVETVQDSVYRHWDVIDAEVCSNKLLEMVIESSKLNKKVKSLQKRIGKLKKDYVYDYSKEY